MARTPLKHWGVGMGKSIWIVLWLLSPWSWAQQESPQIAAPLKRNVDSDTKAPERRVGLSIKITNQDFALKQKTDTDKSVQFKPSDQLTWGLDGAYDGYRFGLGLPMPQDKEEVRRTGRTRRLDLMFGHYEAAWGGDVYLQRYKGFYIDDDKKKEDEIFQQRPDVKTILVGTNLYFSFAPDRFPLNVYSSPDANKNSRGGSALGMLSYNQFRFKGNRPLIEDNGLVGGYTQTVIAGAGYGYHWIRNRHALMGQILLGFGPQWRDALYSNGNRYRVEVTRQASVNGNYSYDWSQWQAGLKFKLNTFSGNIDPDHQIDFDSLEVKVFGSREF